MATAPGFPIKLDVVQEVALTRQRYEQENRAARLFHKKYGWLVDDTKYLFT